MPENDVLKISRLRGGICLGDSRRVRPVCMGSRCFLASAMLRIIVVRSQTSSCNCWSAANCESQSQSGKSRSVERGYKNKININSKLCRCYSELKGVGTVAAKGRHEPLKVHNDAHQGTVTLILLTDFRRNKP